MAGKQKSRLPKPRLFALYLEIKSTICYYVVMKNQVGILIFLILIVFFGAMIGSFRAFEPVADAQAERMLRYPDPYEQVLDHRRADSTGTAVIAVLAVLVIVIIGIGFYALSDRYTKAARATKALVKPARRAARAPTLQPVQPVQQAQLTGGAGSQQWENSQPQQPQQQ